MKRPIRVLTVFNEIGWGGDESRLLSMAVAIDHTRFEHIVLTLLDHSRGMEHAGLSDRAKQYADRGVVIKSLSGEEPERIRPQLATGRFQRKLTVLHRATQSGPAG